MKNNNSYKEIVEFLYNQYPVYQKQGKKAYKPDLNNIKKICEILENPQESIKTIHVAGTNGKGSVCNIIYNIYKKNGFKVGIFSSPHLYDFRERIVINDEWISKKYITDFYKSNFELFEKIKPSFFEWTTALAFNYFKDNNTKINIIETGLGGRLDSTNIITPELSIITTIGLDHQNILGNSLEKIAKEKAGIIKNNIPTLVGPEIAKLEILTNICKEKNAKLFKVDHAENKIISKLPNYQLNNWKTAKKAVNILNPEIFLKEDPLDYITLKGRWQIVEKKPKIILDIGHNKEGIKEIKKQLRLEEYNSLHLVLGFSNDKNLDEILKNLPEAKHIYLTKSKNERALDPEILKTKLNKKTSLVFQDFRAAFLKIKGMANEDDLILVTGSAFLVSDILKEFY